MYMWRHGRKNVNTCTYAGRCRVWSLESAKNLRKKEHFNHNKEIRKWNVESARFELEKNVNRKLEGVNPRSIKLKKREGFFWWGLLDDFESLNIQI